MNIAPVSKALRRHKTAVTLIVLQIAVCCAILCNSIYLIKARVDRMTRPSGVAENELVGARLRLGGCCGRAKQQGGRQQRGQHFHRYFPHVVARKGAERGRARKLRCAPSCAACGFRAIGCAWG